MTNKWVHCPECGHRMFFLKEGFFLIEIKCTSCKRIVKIDTGRMATNEKVYRDNALLTSDEKRKCGHSMGSLPA